MGNRSLDDFLGGDAGDEGADDAADSVVSDEAEESAADESAEPTAGETRNEDDESVATDLHLSGGLIVDVDEVKRLPAAKMTVRVKSLETLASLAERHDSTILHLADGEAHRYFLHANDHIYYWDRV